MSIEKLVQQMRQYVHSADDGSTLDHYKEKSVDSRSMFWFGFCSAVAISCIVGVLAIVWSQK